MSQKSKIIKKKRKEYERSELNWVHYPDPHTTIDKQQLLILLKSNSDHWIEITHNPQPLKENYQKKGEFT